MPSVACLIVMLSVTNGECQYAMCHYAECRGAMSRQPLFKKCGLKNSHFYFRVTRSFFVSRKILINKIFQQNSV